MPTDLHTHTHMYALKKISHWLQIPFLSFTHQLPHIQTSTTYEKRTKLARTKKTITDSGFLYNIFTEKPYAHTLFKIFITDYQFLTSHSLTFNLTSEKCKLSPSAGILFRIPIFVYISLAKWVYQNPLQFTHDCTTQFTQVPQYKIFFYQTSYRTYKTNSPYLIKEQIMTTSKNLTGQFPLFQRILPSVPQIVKMSRIWITSLGLYLEPVSDTTLSTPRQLPFVCYTIQLYKLTMFVSQSYSCPNRFTPRKLPVLCDIIYLRSRLCNCIQRYSPDKVSCVFIFFL